MKIGVATCGGDAPGMNAAIRAIVRYAIPRKLETVGVEGGYRGLIMGQVIPLDLRSLMKTLTLALRPDFMEYILAS